MKRSATARAHTNIALIKYWGKKDQQLIIPQTDSLSLTLDKFYTDTTVTFDSGLKTDKLVLNGQLLDATATKRVSAFLDIVRQQSGISDYAHIKSQNHVPTSAGLASSASAFAALAGAASRAAGMSLSKRDLSRLARRGSGSATRSIFGGLVQWHRGTDDQSSYAEPIDQHPDFGLRMTAILLSQKAKRISSRHGMQEVVQTSPYYPAWRQVVAKDMQRIKRAIADSDINSIGKIAESNAMRMHALNLSAEPDFCYFNADTLKAMDAIKDLRSQGVSCYYTMDAGPNVKAIYNAKDQNVILSKLSAIFGANRLVTCQAGSGIRWLEN